MRRSVGDQRRKRLIIAVSGGSGKMVVCFDRETGSP